MTMLKIISLLIIFTLPYCVEAAEEKYTLEYAFDSPIKTVPLKEVVLEIALFQYNNPAGLRELKTDENQTFTLNGAYNLEILSIENQAKYKAKCSGYGMQGNPKVFITCTGKE